MKFDCYIKNSDTKKNSEIKIIYQKARYEKNCKKKIEYDNRKYKESLSYKSDITKMKYKENSEIPRQYKKEVPS